MIGGFVCSRLGGGNDPDKVGTVGAVVMWKKTTDPTQVLFFPPVKFKSVQCVGLIATILHKLT